MSLAASQSQSYRPAPSTSSLVTPSLLALEEPPLNQNQIDGSVQDYLLIELVHTLRHSSRVARERVRHREEEMVANGLLAPAPVTTSTISTATAGGFNSGRSSAGTNAVAAVAGKAPLNEDEAIRVRLEALGAHVGANLAERLCVDRNRFADTLDVVKFLCKDVWTAVWDKQIDNLRTNHRGVYVLQDNAFRPIMRISSPEGPADSLRRAKMHTAFPAGLLRGALARLGLQGVVIAEITSLPQCTFQVKLPKGT